MMRDLGQKRHDEREPSQGSEAVYRALFDHAQIGVVLADAQSTYIDANAAACRMLGYSRDELIGLNASDIVERADVEHIAPALGEIGSRSLHEREWQFRRKDGSIFSADVVATRLPDGTLLGMINDVSDRKRADDYRAHLAAIVESSLDAVIGTDLDGLVTSWNASAEAIFGYAAEEMIGASITRLIPDDRRSEADTTLEIIRRGEGVTHVETLRRSKDGRLIDVSIVISPIRNAQGRIVGASRIARDISALKERAAENARISRLYAALSQINQAIVWSETRDDLFGKACRALVEQGGFGMAWIGWRSPGTDLLVPAAVCGDDNRYLESVQIYVDDRPEGRGPSGRAFRSGRPYICNDVFEDPATLPWRAEMRRRGIHASAALPIRDGGEVRGVLTVYADRPDFFRDKETELLEEVAADLSFALDNFARDEARRLAEKKVADEKTFADMMIESMPGIVYFYDLEGRFLRWNRNFEAVSGYSGEEIARMHPRDFFAERDRPLLDRRIADVFETGEAHVEAPFVSKSGIATPYFLTGRRVEFQEKVCLVGVGIDISARRELEAEREIRRRAEAADKIKSAFLATMSHELRTPLNSIIGFTGIVLRGLAGPLNPEQEKQLGMVRTSARHLLALVNDVLDISKIEAGQLEIACAPFDPCGSVTKVVGLVKPQAEAKGLDLRVDLPASLGTGIGDERRFEQILLNLLSNAIKFTDRGTISLVAEMLDAYVSPGASAGRPAIRLRVTDTGIGIRPEDLSTLFEPFRQIDTGLSRAHEGTGLGLAICRRLAGLMGGEITAESHFGSSSTFIVTLPLNAGR